MTQTTKVVGSSTKNLLGNWRSLSLPLLLLLQVASSTPFRFPTELPAVLSTDVTTTSSATRLHLINSSPSPSFPESSPAIDHYFPSYQEESSVDTPHHLPDIRVESPDNSHSNSNSSNSTSIRICKSPDISQLNECLRQVLEDLKPRIADGIPEIGLPGMDPLFIPQLSFEHGGGSIKINANFANIEVTGLSKFNESHFWVDTVNQTMDFDVTFPHALLAGSYQLSGNLLFVPVAGDGHFWLNLGGVRCKGTGNLISSPSSLNNGTHDDTRRQQRLTLRQTTVDLNITSIKVHLTNLFNGDQLLGPVINNFLNENSQEIFDELRPQIGEQVGEMLSLLANKALSVLPSDYFPQIINVDDDTIATATTKDQDNDEEPTNPSSTTRTTAE